MMQIAVATHSVTDADRERAFASLTAMGGSLLERRLTNAFNFPTGSANLTLAGNRAADTEVRRATAQSFEERIFDAGVALKVAVSKFAMHLSAEERHRLFAELDDKINVDDWHEEDKLPAPASFVQFLKWMIYTRQSSWTSIGVSPAGTITVAWRTPKVLLTADFDVTNSVRWTARQTGENGEVGHSAGKCTLKLFADQAMFYLKPAGD
jgi:hypothetical protein